MNQNDLANLADYAQDMFQGKIDHWVNNAGVCEGPEDFTDISLETIENVINTNIMAVLIGTKMATNIRAHNIYAISGHGSGCTRTPEFSVYGASKAAISQFYSSIIEETNKKAASTTSDNDYKSAYHIIAPGIMKTQMTEKLLSQTSQTTLTKLVFDHIALDPEYVASKVVPKMIAINGNGNVIRPYF